MKLAGIAGRGNEIVDPGLPSNHEQWRAQRTNCRWEMWRIIEDTPVGNTSTNMFPRKALAMQARNGHRAVAGLHGTKWRVGRENSRLPMGKSSMPAFRHDGTTASIAPKGRGVRRDLSEVAELSWLCS